MLSRKDRTTAAATALFEAVKKVDGPVTGQAIRDALVETTIAAPVRVQSYGWIDTEGRLHETGQDYPVMVAGAGLFKSNASALLGQLYTPGDGRRSPRRSAASSAASSPRTRRPATATTGAWPPSTPRCRAVHVCTRARGRRSPRS